MGFDSALKALATLIKTRHLSKELLNYLSATYFEKKNLTSEKIDNELNKLLFLVNGLSVADHKTIFFDELRENILTDPTLSNHDHVTLCILSLNLIMLGVHPTRILEKVFDGAYDYSVKNFLNWTFCKIYQNLKTDPNYKGLMPLQSQIESLRKMHKTVLQDKRPSSLLHNLEEGIGGPTYVKTKVATKLFHIIGIYLFEIRNIYKL